MNASRIIGSFVLKSRGHIMESFSSINVSLSVQRCRSVLTHMRQRRSSKLFGYLAGVSFVKVLEWMGKSKPESEFSKAMKDVRASLKQGNIRGADEKLIKATKEFEPTNDERKEAMLLTGLIRIAQTNYKIAEETLRKLVEQFKSEQTPKNNLKFIYAKLKLAEIQQGLFKFSEARELLDECYRDLSEDAYAAAKANNQEVLELWTKVLFAKGYLYLNTGQNENACDILKQAYDVCVKFRGEINEQAIKILALLGETYYANEDHELALQCLLKARECGKHLPQLTHMYRVYILLGHIYYNRDMLDLALKAYQEGLMNTRRHLLSEETEFISECIDRVEAARN